MSYATAKFGWVSAQDVPPRFEAEIAGIYQQVYGFIAARLNDIAWDLEF